MLLKSQEDLIWVVLGIAVGLLASSDQPTPQVLKVAILAEKYAVDYTWYVDTILNLIRIAGDYVSEEVWYRVIQIVINRDDVQGYAAKTVFEVRLGPRGREAGRPIGGDAEELVGDPYLPFCCLRFGLL